MSGILRFDARVHAYNRNVQATVIEAGLKEVEENYFGETWGNVPIELYQLEQEGPQDSIQTLERKNGPMNVEKSRLRVIEHDIALLEHGYGSITKILAQLDAIKEVLGKDIPIHGFETYGEICMDPNQFSGFHNTTTVIALIPS